MSSLATPPAATRATGGPDVLVVASMRRWVADEFRAATDRAGLPLIHSWGLDVPDLTGHQRPAWWAPTEHAARLLAARVTLPLLAPGPFWLASVPVELTGRHIWAGQVADLDEAPPRGFAKPAEIKVEQLPAAWWDDTRQLADTARRLGLPDDTVVQVSPTRLDLLVEHRCFIRDGRVLTSSPYLLADGTTYHDGMQNDPNLHSADARAFATDAVAQLGRNQPPAYVLDVARTRAGAWVVLEANPAFSSAVYGADIDAALETVLAATDHADRHPRWRWRPDPWLTRRAARMTPLPRR